MPDNHLKVFISYSQQDKALQDKLRRQLVPIKTIEIWHDRCIQGGEEWDAKIQTALNAADLILLLISAEFMDSTYCQVHEIPRALERHEAGDASVIPVILRPCLWEETSLAKLQAYPKNLKPITTWQNEDEALLNVAEGIRDAAATRLDKRRLQSESQAQYMRKLEEAYADGVITLIERMTLDHLKEDLALSDEVAAEMEEAVARPQAEKQKKLRRYEEVLRVTIEQESYPLGEELQAELATYRESQGLTRQDIEAIESRLLAEAVTTKQLKPIFTNRIGITFVFIPAGEFTMGSTNSDPHARDGEKPDHRVVISEPFYLAQHPVTQAQWQAIMGTNPSVSQDANCPVENVSWEDAQAFLQKLNELEGGNHYRLPTEAQWEYACRATSNTAYAFGDDGALLGDYAWYRDNAGDKPHPVGQKKPNAWNLYDMHGNVREWVQDRRGSYSSDAVTDPTGPPTGVGRCFRGGSYKEARQDLRSAHRLSALPGYTASDIGFRCLYAICAQG
ncbi:SUMF1/EgtB/PvdO family nonheme iron enzyme [Candidatus Entotheonella palauensis]|uniref:SUMF1/EgtB/PvdO family nonheme iron enzyme n=1 Tax=Candidatus Entotheonella palauensis TaxID=93172 RepID=UPI000B7D6002|nr:SUMF1/EgtB/PvdO family nonheme iron enzyme [Candidatus Entotheonella palauensis]